MSTPWHPSNSAIASSSVFCCIFNHPCDGAGKALKKMRLLKLLVIVGCLSSLAVGPAPGADNPPKKLTCCEKAAADGKDCSHKCCLAAHKDGKSCEKCNPNKEDLKLKKRKADKKADK